jgi:trimeric autotransporter adhesin
MSTNTRTFGRLWISTLPLLVVFAIGSTVANAQTRIGTAQSVKPEASGSIAGTLSAGSGVHASETVHTGSSGQADLRFLDNSNLTVGPGSSVRLDKFVYDPNKGSGSVAVEASRGAFRFVAASQNKGEVKVKTPSGTLGIRG